MGYSITIGELDIQKNPEDGLEASCLWFSAIGVSIDGSPAFGEPTDSTNQRWPSYSAWSNFMDYVGLTDVFFFDGNLIGGHPGVRLVTNNMVSRIKEAREKLESMDEPPLPTMENYTEKNGYYCRLIWLEYWCEWAIENCNTPVIANS